jgi:hypothetical protein
VTWKRRHGGILVDAAVGMIESNLETGLNLLGGLLLGVRLMLMVGHRSRMVKPVSLGQIFGCSRQRVPPGH